MIKRLAAEPIALASAAIACVGLMVTERYHLDRSRGHYPQRAEPESKNREGAQG